jgi:hypothetical protein
MKILVAVKRVIDYAAKIRVKSDKVQHGILLFLDEIKGLIFWVQYGILLFLDEIRGLIFRQNHRLR